MGVLAFSVFVGAILVWYVGHRRGNRRAGNYKLRQTVADRAAVTVHIGVHRRSQQPAAIKVLKPLKDNQPALDRFCQEIAVLRQLSSCHVPKFFEAGKTAAGQPYMATEWIAGTSLYEAVGKRGCWNDARTLRALIDLARGLAAIHEIGFRHGDVQPSNALIQPLPQSTTMAEIVRLIDFGLARPIADPLHESLATSHSTRVLGTPAFAAPEVAKTAAQDHRSDIFSLGCVGYYLLSGRAPVSGRTPIEIYWKQIHETPTPIVDAVAEPMAAELAEIIHACLLKSPNERPTSAAQLAEQLSCIEPQSSWTMADALDWWKLWEPDPFELVTTQKHARQNP